MKLDRKYMIILSIFLVFISICKVNSFEEQTRSTNVAANKAELNVHGKIFVSEKTLKTKNKKQPKGEAEEYVEVPEHVDLGRSYPSEDDEMSLKITEKGPIYKQMWVKFFKYREEDTVGDKTPRMFFRNVDFDTQAKLHPKVDLDAIDDEGIRTYIKSNSYFYAMLFRNSLNVVTSRNSRERRTFAALYIENMGDVWEIPYEENDLGSIIDFGNFKEGYCMKIIAEKPSREYWVICLDSLEEKTDLMSLIKKLRIQYQRSKGIFKVAEEQKKKEETLKDIMGVEYFDSQTLNKTMKRKMFTRFNHTSSNITDCYWIVLQHWSQCSLKCGGGISTLHRMKVPAKNGGKDCEGEAIMTKKCNIEPCPNVTETREKITNRTTNRKPILKVLPFSSRPLRFSKCIIKEGEFLLIQKPGEIHNNPTLQPPLRGQADKLIPVRAVMNNSTFTLFAGEDYTTLVLTFTLASTTFLENKNNTRCFLLQEADRQASLCPFATNNVKEIIEEWDYDFHLFKYQCHQATPTIDSDEKMKKIIKTAKHKLMLQQEIEIKKKLQIREKKKYEKKIQDTNDKTLQAIKKEMTLEDMVKQEEEQKLKEEEEELMLEIEKEKKKNECLTQNIAERTIEDQYNLRSREYDDEINTIKKNFAEEMKIKRNKLKSTIVRMREDSSKKKDRLRQELLTVRQKMAEKMKNAYKLGNKMNCIKGNKDDKVRVNYCTANFMENINEFGDCKDGPDFCTICCEHEFGEFHQGERIKCVEECLGKVEEEKKSEEDEDLGAGRWIFIDANNNPQLKSPIQTQNPESQPDSQP